jgi:hypothetical protein
MNYAGLLGVGLLALSISVGCLWLLLGQIESRVERLKKILDSYGIYE